MNTAVEENHVTATGHADAQGWTTNRPTKAEREHQADGTSRGGCGGTCSSAVARCRALRELARAEAALQQVQLELFHATRLKTVGELAASIAHELNQPLVAIIADANAGLNWLNGSTSNVSAVRESLEAIARDGARAGDVVSSVRALVERTPRARSACDVSTVVASVLPLLREQMQRARIVVEPLLTSDLPSVMADPVELQQVVLNLVVNAIDAALGSAPERRRIRVQSAAERRADVPWVVVSVEDQGPGIAVADASRLFTPFFTTKPGGLGLGLSISRSIVERHGGLLWTEAGTEPGAIFRFALPAIS